MSPCAECPLIAAAQVKNDPLAERRAYAAAQRASAVAEAAAAIIAAASWSTVQPATAANFRDVGAWSPPWARTPEGRKARTEEIVAWLRADYGERAVEQLREEVKRRRAQKVNA